MNEEIWKDIPGYEGCYQASNLGRIKRVSRKIYKDFKSERIPELILKTKLNKKGYPMVRITESGHRRTLIVHRLIAKTFIPNPQNKLEVNHVNSVRNDNRVENLEWCTREENIRHSYKFGNGATKKVDKLDLQGNFICSYKSLREAADDICGNRDAISNCCCGITKTSGGYKWRLNPVDVEKEKRHTLSKISEEMIRIHDKYHDIIQKYSEFYCSNEELVNNILLNEEDTLNEDAKISNSLMKTFIFG